MSTYARHRYLYGLGGLADAFTPVFQLDSSLVERSTPELSALMSRLITASGQPDPTNPQQQGAQQAATCDCAIRTAQAHFNIPPDALSQLNQACSADPASFVVALQQQANDQGVTLDFSTCGGNGGGNGGNGGNGAPWYKQTRTWLIGGGIVAGVALLALATR